MRPLRALQFSAVTRFAACLLLLAACSNDSGFGPGNETTQHATKTGVLANSALIEASGLAHSNKQDDLIWAINDGGSPATLYAVGHDGSDLGEVGMSNLQNIDWEDLASFEYDGKSMLLIADVGDNLSLRNHVTVSYSVLTGGRLRMMQRITITAISNA